MRKCVTIVIKINKLGYKQNRDDVVYNMKIEIKTSVHSDVKQAAK